MLLTSEIGSERKDPLHALHLRESGHDASFAREEGFKNVSCDVVGVGCGEKEDEPIEDSISNFDVEIFGCPLKQKDSSSLMLSVSSLNMSTVSSLHSQDSAAAIADQSLVNSMLCVELDQDHTDYFELFDDREVYEPVGLCGANLFKEAEDDDATLKSFHESEPSRTAASRTIAARRTRTRRRGVRRTSAANAVQPRAPTQDDFSPGDLKEKVGSENQDFFADFALHFGSTCGGLNTGSLLSVSSRSRQIRARSGSASNFDYLPASKQASLRLSLSTKSVVLSRHESQRSLQSASSTRTRRSASSSTSLGRSRIAARTCKRRNGMDETSVQCKETTGSFLSRSSSLLPDASGTARNERDRKEDDTGFHEESQPEASDKSWNTALEMNKEEHLSSNNSSHDRTRPAADPPGVRHIRTEIDLADIFQDFNVLLPPISTSAADAVASDRPGRASDAATRRSFCARRTVHQPLKSERPLAASKVLST